MPAQSGSDFAGQLSRNSVSGFIRFVVLTAVYFLTYPYLVHHLGLQRFGLWALAPAAKGVEGKPSLI